MPRYILNCANAKFLFCSNKLICTILLIAHLGSHESETCKTGEESIVLYVIICNNTSVRRLASRLTRSLHCIGGISRSEQQRVPINERCMDYESWVIRCWGGTCSAVTRACSTRFTREPDRLTE